MAEYMWLCEEALSKDVLKSWEAHVDGKGDVYFFDTETESSAWEHPLADYYHNYYLSLKAKNMSVRVVPDSSFPLPQPAASRRPERGPSGEVRLPPVDEPPRPPDVGLDSIREEDEEEDISFSSREERSKMGV